MTGMEQIFDYFCDSVLSAAPRATRREREDIRRELADHLSDHAEMLGSYGVEEEEARHRAVEAMGDPADIGKAFNDTLSPFWLWLGYACKLAVLFLLVFNIGEVFCLAGRAADGMKLRHSGEEALINSDDPGGYTLFWSADPGVEEPFGDHVIRIPKVELWQSVYQEDDYLLRVYMTSYHQKLLGCALDVSVILSMPEYGPDIVRSSGAGTGDNYVAMIRRDLYVEPGTECITVTLDYNGNRFETGIDLDWGGAA